MFEDTPSPLPHWTASESHADLRGDAGVLLASIVHDFNNFLTPIVSIMEELRRQKVGSPLQLRRIDGALLCAKRANTLARQVVTFASAHEPQPKAVDIWQLVDSLEPALTSVLTDQTSIIFDVARDLPPAFIDRELMERALLNLILNARDATQNGGQLLVTAVSDHPPVSSTATRTDMLRISVVDTGVGMDPATVQNVGSPYFSTKRNGTGLGLAMVRRMVEAQGGQLQITTAPQQGTAIELWLPMASCREE